MSGNRISTSRTKGGGGPSRKAKKPNKPNKHGWLRTFIKYALIGGVVMVLMVCAVFYLAYQKTTIPDPNAAFQTQSTYVYYKDGHTKLGQYADQNRESISLAEIPKSMQDAVVAAEDRTFWTNKGIDPKSILRAAFSNAKGNATQGASTITQQYVKILYLTQERTLGRKIKEAFLSLKIQQEQSKQEILQGYLNTIYFGRGAYGVQAAAHAYFGIDAKKLNAGQSAMLASVLNSPSYLSPDGSAAGKQALLARYGYVLDGMAKVGTLSSSRADTLKLKLPKTVKQKTSNQYEGQKGFQLTLVKNELERIGFDEATIDGGGLRVTTTMSPQAMAADKAAVVGNKPNLKGLHVGVASVDVKTGGLLGFYGGQNFLQSQLNYATLPAGSVGSSFKPFALAAGIKQGFSLKDTFDGNSPYTFPDGSTVKNEGEGTGENLGAHISLLTALEQSVNTAFVDMTASMKNGPSAIKKMALAMGVPSTDDVQDNARIALGSASISPVDMANAYSTIANGGVHHAWYVVSKVTRASDGKVLYTAPKKHDRVISADIAADVSYAMQGVVKAGTGQNALALGRPAAGKTGTATNDSHLVDSSWFIGFTPQVSTAVMYVRGTGHESLENFLVPYFGANYPTETWTDAMRGILQGTTTEDFPPPANLDGTAPSSGHAPYTPPPPPPKHIKTTPATTPSLTPSLTPTVTLTPITPTDTPTDPNPPTCTPVILHPCPS
ncbi:MAG: glycosyl transferase, family 51 [Marmoricola sp.]|nr:glycosyl transferase, family 51 [Marmoricola sp.]